MRIIKLILNSWFSLPPFIVGIFFVAAAIMNAFPYESDHKAENVGLSDKILTSGFILLISLVFFWLSLVVGAYQKKARELKIKMKAEILKKQLQGSK
jgi:hypothetical protein